MLDTFRNALLISLIILLVVMLYRRLKQRVLARDLPAPMHAELVRLEVMYHPARLRVEFTLPKEQRIHPALLSDTHQHLHAWASEEIPSGTRIMELPLTDRTDGAYFFQLATDSQRTERRFILRQA